MLRVSDGTAPVQIMTSPVGRMRGGFAASLALHGLALLLLFLVLPWLSDPAVTLPRILPVDLVRLADITAAPRTAERAAVPQQPAAAITPAASAPTTAAAAEPREAAPAPPLASPKSEEARVPPPRKNAAAARTQHAPADALTARLQQLAQLKSPAAPAGQAGSGASNLTARNEDAAVGNASYRVKDFIRTQVERHWSLDRKAVAGGNWIVQVHILLDPDGSVRRAEIVESPLLHSSAAYRELAQSARNAVLLASPIALPPGAYQSAKDIVLDFDLGRDSN